MLHAMTISKKTTLIGEVGKASPDLEIVLNFK